MRRGPEDNHIRCNEDTLSLLTYTFNYTVLHESANTVTTDKKTNNLALFFNVVYVQSYYHDADTVAALRDENTALCVWRK